MAANIFISYRRDDAAAWAGRLHMALERNFRREQIFMDVDSIEAGLDFAKVIDAEVAKCDVMLVVIGKDWLDVRDAAGRRRLDDPADFVRLEVESALRRDIRVVPVLVDGASLPKAEQLPEGMRGLVRRQAWPLSHARFGAESEGLIGEILARRRERDSTETKAHVRASFSGAKWLFTSQLGLTTLFALLFLIACAFSVYERFSWQQGSGTEPPTIGEIIVIGLIGIALGLRALWLWSRR